MIDVIVSLSKKEDEITPFSNGISCIYTLYFRGEFQVDFRNSSRPPFNPSIAMHFLIYEKQLKALVNE